MDDDSESTELMEEVPQLDYASQNWRDWCVVDREKPRVDSTDDGKHTGKNDLLFVGMMGKQVWPKMKSECCKEAELWLGYADMKVRCHLSVN